ncbi:MAG TPA: GldG family protein [Polyangiaceae bacterium]|nr:GldG family protein [Polyangiaceae bacterium]
MSRPRIGQLVHAFGVLAAMALAVFVNVLVSRHYRRWDLTTNRLYTLSPATLQTLHGLGERIEVDVLLSASDPLASSVKFLLNAYEAESDKLVVRYVDPDQKPAEILALQQKYGIEAGKTEDGHVVTDAAVIMSREKSKPFFLSSAELFDEGEHQKARSKVEQAFTLTLRNVMNDERARVCFTTGHGEKRLEEGGPRGLAELASRLRKNNIDPEEVDTSLPSAADPLRGCRAALIVSPSEPFAEADAARIRTWFEAGGNLMIFSSPIPDSEKQRMLDLGLDAVTRAGGIEMDETFVFEQDPSRKLPGGFGEQYLAEPKAHAITEGLVGEKNRDLKILVTASRSLSRTGDGSVVPAEILSTSPDAFAMTDFFAWAGKGGPPKKTASDRPGPLAVAMAAELPNKASGAAHGPRMVVVGASNLALGQNWQERVLRGGAIFVESAISWLSAMPAMVDVPDKPAFAGARINEASLGEVFRYVVLYMPFAILLLGVAVYLRRRITESAPEETKGAGAP